MDEGKVTGGTRIALRSRRTVVPDGVRDAVVIVDDGRITSVLDPRLVNGPVRDLGDLVVMPGLVDAHVHVNEPGRTEWEGFETATMAAAAGGITTIVDMPLNCIPVTTTVDALRIKLEACAPLLWVDTAFWGGVVPGNAGELGPMVKAGVRGAKCFLVHSGIDDFPNVTEADLRPAMRELAKAGVPLLVHAELDLTSLGLGLAARPSGLQGPAEPSEASPRAYSRFLASRPHQWEDRAIELVVRLCRETGCKVHIVHLSSADALPILRAAKKEGLPITVETCPHYLTIRAEDVPDGATEYKCCPPIRGDQNRERLWEGLRDGTIDQVVSDHSPCTPHLKLPERGDFLEAWGGVASLQLGLSVVWTEARKRGFGLEDVARWMCARTAKLAGLTTKGSIAPGMDADLVAWDPDERWEVTPERIFHKHKVTPYRGRTVEGAVKVTVVRGQPVWAEGRHVAKGGRPLVP